MDLFTCLGSIYTSKNSLWINEVEGISSVVVHKFIGMNKNMLKYARWLDKYVYNISIKSYLLLAWSIIPKVNKAPFVKYRKAKVDSEEWEEVFVKVKKFLCLGDNDFECSKKRLLEVFEKDKIGWFKKLGMSKKVWKKHSLDFEEMRVAKQISGPKGLDLFM